MSFSGDFRFGGLTADFMSFELLEKLPRNDAKKAIYFFSANSCAASR